MRGFKIKTVNSKKQSSRRIEAISSNDSDMQSKTDSTPPNETVDDVYLPEASKRRYIRVYNNFIKWRANQKDQSFSERVFMTYFTELSKTVMPSTLWCVFSMLRSTVLSKHDINVRNYKKLRTFLQKQSQEIDTKVDNKTKVFTAEEVENFINYAPDEIHLATKVVLIFGISGACTSNELVNIMVEDVKKQGKSMLIDLRGRSGKIVRGFTVRDRFAQLVERYQSLRPENLENKRFFIKYYYGKCYKQVMGINKILDAPKHIAGYLNLPNSVLYTGWCFKKTAKFLADVTSSKRRGDHMEEPVNNKSKKYENETTNSINIRLDQPRTVTANDVDYLQEDQSEVIHIADENYPRCCPVGFEIQPNTKKETLPSPFFDERTVSPTLTNRYKSCEYQVPNK